MCVAQASSHPLTAGNYLASPPLVVVYALAGTTNIDITTEPLGTGSDGQPVYLRDVWPSSEEVCPHPRHPQGVPAPS